ncbi:MAG TPA: hypothetical protein VKX16_15380 [Chloroflexota bacterium]|nr:hypothetical protein [Chloroflexota bacterium]
MNRRVLQIGVFSLIALCIGIAGTAAVFAFIPDSGSPPAIFDDFNWSSISNGYWHVNPIGATAVIKSGLLTLSGHSVELDRRLQTDPKETVVAARVRALSFNKFGLGIGVYHSGTVGMEFDADGIKCGRGTDHGYQVDFLKGWKTPPVGQWFYLEVTVVNPYPNPKVLQQLGDISSDKLKKVKVICAAYDSQGHLISRVSPTDPPANSHYVAFDEVFMRTWDSNNRYQVDWFYAGPPSGDPLIAVARRAPK